MSTADGAAATDRLLGATLGEFEILERIGQGGMGTVYKARQPSLDRLVAVKVLRDELAARPAFVERLYREAQAAARLQHGNVVEVHAVDEAEGRHYIAMEYIDGPSLADLLSRQGPLDSVVAADILTQVCAALVVAHAAGIIHCDVKPSNILLDADGTARITDFGLARHTESEEELAAGGPHLGTPLYLSPEVADAEPATPRSDLYSLGATFYHLLAGRPPFEGVTYAELVVKHAMEQATPLAETAPGVDPGLAGLIGRLLSKDPDERPVSAAAVLAELDPSHPLTRGPSEPEARARRVPTRAIVLGAAAVVLAAIALFVVRPWGRAPDDAAAQAAAVHENQATALYNQAVTAARNEDWTALKQTLDALDRAYSHTKLHASERDALARLRTRAEKGTADAARPKPTTPTPPAPPPKPAPPPAKPRPAPPAPEATGAIFDGTSLNGWLPIEGARRARRPVARIEDECLVLAPGQPFTGVCWTPKHPRIDYELAFEAMRVQGRDQFAGIILPVGKARCSWYVGAFGGRVVGLEILDGKGADKSVTTAEVDFENGLWYRIRLRVERDRIQGWINDTPLLDEKLAGRKLKLPSWMNWRLPHSLAILAHKGTKTKLRRIHLRALGAKPPKAGHAPAPTGYGALVREAFEPFGSDYHLGDLKHWLNVGNGVSAADAQLRLKAPKGEDRWLIIEDREFGDFSLEADLSFPSAQGGDLAGIEFRRVAGQQILFALSPGRRQATADGVRGRKAGPVYGVEGVTAKRRQIELTVQSGRAYRLKAECLGTQVRCYLDGRLVGEITDRALLKGQIAVHARGVEAHFRNLSVAPLDRTPAEPPDELGRLWFTRAQHISANPDATDLERFQAWADIPTRFPNASAAVTAAMRKQRDPLRAKLLNSDGIISDLSRRYQYHVINRPLREVAGGRLRMRYYGLLRHQFGGVRISQTKDWDNTVGLVTMNKPGHMCSPRTRFPLNVSVWAYSHGDGVRLSFEAKSTATHGFTLFGLAGAPLDTGIVLTVGKHRIRTTTVGIPSQEPWLTDPMGAVNRWVRHELGVLGGVLTYRRDGKELLRRPIDPSALRGRRLVFWNKTTGSDDKWYPAVRDVVIETPPQSDWVPLYRDGPTPPRTTDQPDVRGWLGIPPAHLGTNRSWHSKQWDMGSGCMRIVHAEGLRRWQYTRSDPVRDAVVIARAEFLDRPGEDGESSVGLMFRFWNANTYVATVHRRGGTRLRRQDTRGDETIATSPEPASVGRFLHLAMIVQDKRLELYCNGHLVLSHSDLAPVAGRVGFETDRATAVFHDFKYRPLPSDPAYRRAP